MPVEIVYETHALTVDNETGFATGWLPGRLSADGRTQARELGWRRRSDGITTVFTSDLARAVETAEIAFSNSDIPVHQDPRLRECDYGIFNGAPVDELDAIRPQHIHNPFPEGQSYQDVVNQTHDFLTELARGWNGQKVLVIAHTANRWALDHLLNNVPLQSSLATPFTWQEGWHYTLPTPWPAS